jgi:hypothetical protein
VVMPEHSILQAIAWPQAVGHVVTDPVGEFGSALGVDAFVNSWALRQGPGVMVGRATRSTRRRPDERPENAPPRFRIQLGSMDFPRPDAFLCS